MGVPTVVPVCRKQSCNVRYRGRAGESRTYVSVVFVVWVYPRIKSTVKHQFVCQQCEYELNAGYNASKNIARKLLKRLHSEQKSSNGGARCQCALTSGTLNLNDDFHASVTSTAEGASPDKPTAAVAGY